MKDTNSITKRIKNLALEAKKEREPSKRIRRLEDLQTYLRELEQELKLPQEMQKEDIFAKHITKNKKKEYLKELNISEEEIKKFVKYRKIRENDKPTTKSFSVYKTNFYSRMSNFFLEGISFKLERKYPEQIKQLTKNLAAANINILSKTYLSISLFTGIIIFPFAFVIFLLLLKNIFLTIFLSILLMPITSLAVYKYPTFKMNERSNKLKQELVFAIVHMAAIAGSGAQPAEIFKQLKESKDYDELTVELTRIDNYTNLFGYSMTNSLKAVASLTPSKDLSELLSGIISTIETGGDIRQNLESKAQDALVTFRLDQKKTLNKIETYSDLYTGILIAGPLLMIVTLAILERVSPNLGGISITTIATLGVFVLLPILNIIYMLLLETSKTGI